MVSVEQEESFNSQNVKIVHELSKKRTRSSQWELVFTDGSSFFLLEDILVKHAISNGRRLTDSEWQLIQHENAVYAAMQQALLYLARREHSRFELFQKLINKAYEKQYIHEALDSLEEKDWQSDFRFAKQWLFSRVKKKGEGPRVLFSRLIQKGVNRETAQKALNDVLSEVSIVDLIDLAISKIKKPLSELEQKQYLYKQGFSASEMQEYFDSRIT